MAEIYYDAMAIVMNYSKPDLFITFTCNKYWKEIEDHLLPGQTPDDRPDIVCRVFNLKIKQLINDLVYNKVFGNVTAWMYTVEFQKRDTPHIHLRKLVFVPN